MADVKVRNLPDWLVEWYRQQAAREGISLEECLRQALHEIPRIRRQEIARKLDALCARIGKRTGTLPDSTPLIREIREEMERKGDVGSGRQRGREVARPRRKTA